MTVYTLLPDFGPVLKYQPSTVLASECDSVHSQPVDVDDLLMRADGTGNSSNTGTSPKLPFK